jgi:methionyl-tRNA formyltransferase
LKKVNKIVFMGTPEFAVGTLAALVEGGYNIVGVITAPDKPAGRGKQLQESAVKKYALEKGLKILQPTNLKSETFQAELKALQADIQVVVAFRMLPESVWNMPPLGSVNLHASLLPQYRGAAPINWAIINGEKETGVSTFFLQHEIDTGKIILQEKISIGENDNLGIVYEKLMNIGAKLMLKTIKAIDEGNYPQVEQDHITDIKHAPKIFKEDGRIDWSKSAEAIHNLVRGLSPYPAAWTILDGKLLKIFSTLKSPCEITLAEGEIYATKKEMWIGTATLPIQILELQLEGKRRMKAEEFLSGFQNISGAKVQ